MARNRPSILGTLEQSESSELPEQSTPPEPQESAEAVAAAPAAESERKSGTRRAPARKADRRKDATKQPSGQEAEAAPESGSGGSAKRERPKVLKPESTKAAGRISLYLHPDDKRFLRQEKAECGLDENSYIRAVLALVRHDERLRARARRLAQESRNS